MNIKVVSSLQAKELKAYLLEDNNRICQLLEHFGFHDTWFASGEIRCATPEGTNKTSVSVKLVDELFAASYDDKLSYHGDLFGLLQTAKDTTFTSVMISIHNLFKLEYSKKEKKSLDLLKDIRKFKKGANREVEIKKFDVSVLDEFIKKPHASMIEEAISPLVLDKYDIRFDIQKDRIIFPHYDWEESDMVVGIQGRTTMPSDLAKELNIPKYWNYIKGFQKSRNLFAYNFNKQNIEDKKMIILFEGEKSVLKQATIERGEGFSVAIGGHEISDFHKKFILTNTGSDVEIVIAFDKDIMELIPEEGHEHYLIEQCKRFSKFRKTSYVFDKYNLLESKDSPIDRGLKRWNFLLKHRVQVD